MRKKERPYTIEQLKEVYIDQNFTQKQCAEYFNFPESCISKDIVANKLNKDVSIYNSKRPSKEDLLLYYIEQNHSEKETAKFFNVSPRTLRRYLREYNIHKTIEQQRELHIETCIARYGAPYFQSSQAFQLIKDQMLQKMQETCIKKYGVESIAKIDATKKKREQTCIEKYGVRSVAQISEIAHKKSLRYRYHNVGFDSSWELAVFIYAQDHSESIQREPTALSYKVDNHIYAYFPDFLYKGELIEIKGDHFFNTEGELINPFGDISEQASKRLEAKQKCMQENNVKLWGQKEIQFALDYVKEKYGVRYLQQFKNN